MKYPIGIQTFAEIIDKGYVYIDKTALVYKLANSKLEIEWKQYPVLHIDLGDLQSIQPVVCFETP